VAASLEWGVASRAKAGELASGDLHLVCPTPHGMCVAVVDGLGHGLEAQAAARAAVTALEQAAHEPLEDAIRRCHAALTGTRGAVLSVAQFDATRDSMAWVGVGNVAGLLVSGEMEGRPRRTMLVTHGGIVGSRADLPRARPWVIPVEPGDLVVFATDGIHEGFGDRIASPDPPQDIADAILAGFGKGTDDALVLVARYLGGT
jgi:serine phosphatase RsbU (regulator of sigma subunit)